MAAAGWLAAVCSCWLTQILLLLPPVNDDDAVQINGVDVRTREQAIRMFAESRDDVTLLLARPTSQVGDSFVFIVIIRVISHLNFTIIL